DDLRKVAASIASTALDLEALLGAIVVGPGETDLAAQDGRSSQVSRSAWRWEHPGWEVEIQVCVPFSVPGAGVGIDVVVIRIASTGRNFIADFTWILGCHGSRDYGKENGDESIGQRTILRTDVPGANVA